MRRVLILWLVILWPFAAVAQDSDDRGRLQAFLEDSLSDAGRTVSIIGFEGALSSQARLEELSIADETGTWITLRDVVLSWNRSALLRGALEVEELSAAELILPRLPSSDDSGPTAEASGFDGFSVPELPVSIEIGALVIDRAVIGADILGQDAVFRLSGAAQLAGGAGEASLSVTRTDDGPSGAFELAASFENDTQELEIDLSLAEDSGGIASALSGLPGAPAIDFAVTGDGVLNDFTADIVLATDGTERLGGQITLTGLTDDTERRLAAQIDGDIRPLLPEGEARDFIGPRAALDAVTLLRSDGGVTLERLTLSAQAFEVEGALALAADGWPEAFDLTGQMRPVRGNRITIPGSDVTAATADLSLQYDSAEGAGWTGTVRLTDAQSAQANLGAARLSGAGTITRNGTGLGAVDGDVTLDITGLELADPALAQAVGAELTGALSFAYAEDQPLRFTEIDLIGAGTTARGQITLAGLTDGLRLTVTPDLTVNTPDLGRFSALAGRALEGAARLRLTGRAEPIAGRFDLALNGSTSGLAVDIAQVDPLLEGTGALDAKVRRTEEGTFLETFTLGTDHVTLTAEGALQTGKSRIDYSFDLPRLERALPELPGAFSATGTARQSGETWTVTTDLNAPGNATAQLEARATLTDALGPITGSLTARIDQLSAYSRLAGRSLSGALDARATGTVNPETLAFEVDATTTGQDLSIAQAEVDTLLQGTSTVTAKAQGDGNGAYQIESLQARSSQLRADLSGTYSAAQTNLQFDVGLSDLARFVSGLTGGATAQGTLSHDGGPWQIATDFTGPGGTSARVSGTAAQDFQTVNLAASGSAHIAVANRFIAPNIASGLAQFDLRIDGAPGLDAVSGTVQTSDAALVAPGQPVGLRDIAGTIQLGAGTAQVDITADVTPGGRATVTGPVTLSGDYNANLAVGLRNIELEEPGLLDTTATGNLTVRGPLTGGALIAGRIDLGDVNIRISDAFGSSAGDLPGLTHINTPSDVRQTQIRAGVTDTKQGDNSEESSGPAYLLDVTVAAPSRVFVRGRGLDAELGGTIAVGGTTSAIAPSGRFDLVRGRMDILGKRIDLIEGYAQLRGGLDPAIYLLAQTDSGDIVINITVEGTASSPEISVSSTPDLPQDEVFAQLLFGKDLTEISAFQALRIASAVATLLGKGGDGIVSQLREGFGLDDLDVVTNDDGTTAVRAGKYISENVYSDVTTSSDGDTEINLNLDVSPNLTLRGSAGSDGQTGLGIFFEKDY
ncbi:hypothetical protein E4Z66_11565 [Aliishimia ponticola]|uniref:Translocation and assembly module TamB C-terminal domain-containing protein n=1 Tax=Aliishimia ponticola TaxID=2499833 RepID=A0A4S4N983_9RHOB|nr:translocation/assembly module TamB domain-containing protein [Aliishimia ponticola]THH35719.1 hypothetical protein E4Z66_11565 [Aliishimia ponticola]